MQDVISLQCQCGALRGQLTGLARSRAQRIVCLCDDCQAFAHYLGRAQDILDANAGTDVYPVYPAQIMLTQGVEHLRCLRLTAKGMLRWYAGCCRTPIGNCMAQPRMPYVGMIHCIMNHAQDGTTHEAALGPVHSRVQGKFGIGPLPPGTYEKAPLSLILITIRFLTIGWIKGRHQPSPFFDEKTGRPRVEPYILTPDERENLRKFCGPA
ncbi:DUF6151 family protein [Oligoflexus tunisiensis]|uniref:DUF6151 family protein n=1 Tax=Oligoflexus tunisiensis TaxID=708132 RepID=UPI000A67066D|nr:DUF6151 family protein [Oligoflexus tunisiensis]